MSFGCPGCPHLFHPFPCHAAHRSCLATPRGGQRGNRWRGDERGAGGTTPWHVGQEFKAWKKEKKLEKKGENPERKSCAECASEFVKSWRIQLSKHVCGDGVWKICSSWGYLFSDDLILVLAVLLSDGHYTLSHDEMTHTWIRYPLVGQISFFTCVQCIPTLFDESNQCQISVKSPYFTILEHIPDCCLLPHVCGSKSYVLRVRWWMAEAYFPRYRAYLRGQVNPTCLKPPACFRDV